MDMGEKVKDKIGKCTSDFSRRRKVKVDSFKKEESEFKLYSFLITSCQVLEEITEMLARQEEETVFTDDQDMLINNERNAKLEWSQVCLMRHGHRIKFNRDN